MSEQGTNRGVGRQVATASLWTVLQRLTVRGLGLVSTMILARLLLPEQFGIVAMATSVLALVEVFTALRFDTALIRNLDAPREDYDTAWTLNLLLGLAVAVVMVLAAQPAATFFGEPRAGSVMYALALSPLLEGLRNIGVVEFRKRFQFHREFQLEVWRKLAGVLVNVPLAILWQSHWSLVVATLFGQFVALVMSYRMHPFRPRFSFASSGSLLRFSGWLLALNIVNFLRLRGASFVIGRLGGPAHLGMFNLAYEISNLPTTEIVMPINRAVLPGYAHLVGDVQALKRVVLKVIAVVALFALPAATGVACLASLIVPVMLGKNWLAAIPVIQWLAIFGALTSLQSNLQSLYHAVGRPHLAVTRGLVNVVVLIPLLIWWVRADGLRGAALAYVVAAIVTTPVNFQVALRMTGARWSDVLAVLLRPVAASLVMAALLLALLPQTADIGTLRAAAWLVALGIVGGATYALAIFALWTAAGRGEGAESFAVERFKAVVRKMQRNSPTGQA